MSAASFNALFRAGPLQRRGDVIPDLQAHRAIRLHASPDRDELRGKLQRSRGEAGAAAPRLSRGLDSRLGGARRFGFRDGADRRTGAFDTRQRAIVKIHYFGHGGGGAGALKAHVRYVARDAAARESVPRMERSDGRERAEAEARAHTGYLARHPERSALFYDAAADKVDGAARAAEWARADRRHFRIILSAENAGALGDLKRYVRDVMARAESALGAKLEWLAIDHHDTDNPHTHVILRGRSRDGRALILPRDFVKHGLRGIAQDAATERLGPRTREDQRRALDREIRAHRPTRLDAIIARQLDDQGAIRVAQLDGEGSPELTAALKGRTRELKRLGLARETSRNVLAFQNGWRDQLRAMEMHLDIRKQIVRARTHGPPIGPFIGI